MIDLSFLQNIDLKKSDSLIFLAILFILVIVIVLVMFFVLLKIYKFIKRHFFNKSVGVVIGGGVRVKDVSEIAKKEDVKTTSENADVPHVQKLSTISVQEHKEKEGKKVETEKEKEEKAIQEGLDKLKKENGADKNEGVDSKMPSRDGDNKNDDGKIVIPTAKKFVINKTDNAGVIKTNKDINDKNSNVANKTDKKAIENSLDKLKAKNGSDQGGGGIIGKSQDKNGKIEIPRISNLKDQKINIGAKISPHGGGLDLKAKLGTQTVVQNEKPEILGRPDILKNDLHIGAPKKDETIFGGQSEISRMSLRYKLMKDAKIWKAQRQAGLNMSPLERSKLEKQVFSSAYGRNISKEDLKKGIKSLGKKLLDAKDPVQHAKIRKEIKFFKKIGGIK